MLVLGLDFETTGLNAKSDRVIEIGAVLWDTDKQAPMQVYSEILFHDGIEVSPEIERITGISTEMTKEYGIDPKKGFEDLLLLAEKCDYLVAHNAAFDKSFFDAEMVKLGLNNPNLPWIDTLQDLPFPEDMGTRKLPYLAAEHGFLNPFAHRALFDTLTMMQIFSKYSVDTIIQRAQSPAVEVISHVTYENKDQAKNMGFRWDGSRKTWFKPMKKCDVEKYEFPFQITVNELR